MIEIVKPDCAAHYFLAKVCRDAAKLYDDIMPGAFERQANKYEVKGLPSSYDISLILHNEMQIGFVGSIAVSDDTIYLVALYLLKHYQRMGIGTEVLRKLLHTFTHLSFKEVVLLAHKDAAWAINFYLKNEFYIVSAEEDIKNAYAYGKMARYNLPDTILMKKTLL